MMSMSSPHISGPKSVSHVMLMVVAALIPGIVCQLYFFGWGVFFQIILAVSTALAVEAISLSLRKRPIWFFIKDGSALLSALLLAIALPPFLPWWATVLASSVAIVFGKHIFGGLGHNPFNPAMLSYALMLTSLPIIMTTRWANIEHPGGFVESFNLIFGLATSNEAVDALTGATPLDHYKTTILHSTAEVVTSHPIYDGFGAAGWTWINLAYLAGGLALLWLRIITWHIPVTFLAALLVMSLLFSQDSDISVPITLQMLAGSTMVSAFFIATDPVSAATSNKGKLIYGAGIGFFIYVIRRWGNLPDATATAVLLMNFCAPMIDHYTRPRVYGHQKAIKGYKND